MLQALGAAEGEASAAGHLGPRVPKHTHSRSSCVDQLAKVFSLNFKSFRRPLLSCIPQKILLSCFIYQQ